MKESHLDDEVKADGYGMISVLFKNADIFIYDAVRVANDKWCMFGTSPDIYNSIPIGNVFKCTVETPGQQP